MQSVLLLHSLRNYTLAAIPLTPKYVGTERKLKYTYFIILVFLKVNRTKAFLFYEAADTFNNAYPVFSLKFWKEWNQFSCNSDNFFSEGYSEYFNM